MVIRQAGRSGRRRRMSAVLRIGGYRLAPRRSRMAPLRSLVERRSRATRRLRRHGHEVRVSITTSQSACSVSHSTPSPAMLTPFTTAPMPSTRAAIFCIPMPALRRGPPPLSRSSGSSRSDLEQPGDLPGGNLRARLRFLPAGAAANAVSPLDNCAASTLGRSPARTVALGTILWTSRGDGILVPYCPVTGSAGRLRVLS